MRLSTGRNPKFWYQNNQLIKDCEVRKNMAATALSRPVPTNFWISSLGVEDFTLDDKLVYIYLITNQHFQQVGIYKLPKKVMNLELGMDAERFNTSFNRLENKFKLIKYSNKTNEIAILNYYSFGILRGGSGLYQCFDHLGKKVEDYELLKAMYMASKDLLDDRPAFAKIMSMIKKFLDSIGLLDDVDATPAVPLIEDDDEIPDDYQ